MTALTLADFLRARLGEDEAVAREFVACEYSGVDAWGEGADHFFEGGAGSPARVLADVEAKRRIVEREANSLTPTTWRRELVLRDLASVYAQHPEYRQEWAL